MALLATLLLAQVLQAAALRPCPHHLTGPATAVAQAVGSKHAGMPPLAAMEGRDDAPPGHHEHSGSPCRCLGPCGAGGTATLPVRPLAAVLFLPAAAPLPADDSARPFSSRTAYLLPYPNAPPV